MELVDWLDDLCVRFLLNLPQEELAEAERICFQIEEAQWFYEDFIRPLDPENFPSLNLRNFYMLISKRCPMLCDFSTELHEHAFQKFLAYKTRVPVRGAILLNDKMDEVILVKGWKKGANWSFPRGKINKEESDLDCAIREVFEETGLDLQAANLVTDGNQTKGIEVTMREQHMKLFVFRNVPYDYPFEPRTRKEISKIQWYKIAELPTIKKSKQQQEGGKDALAGNANKFYMVAPFLGPLKKWIAYQKKQDKTNSISQGVDTSTVTTAKIAAEIHQAEESTNEDLAFKKVMDLLRKPVRQDTVDLPEVSTALSVSNAASIPQAQDGFHSEEPLPTKHDLLAFLRSGTGGIYDTAELPPQTPAAQVIEEPKMPRSPPHHHLSRMPTLPVISQPQSSYKETVEASQASVKIPQTRPAPPMQHPIQILPRDPARNLMFEPKNPTTQRRTLAPYHYTSDSRFGGDVSLSENERDKAPPASTLPAPRITAHSANLLSLFKSQATTTTETTSPQGNAALSQPMTQLSKPAIDLVPSQVSSRPPPTLTSENRSMSGQQASLLNLFRKPSASGVPQKSREKASLQLPATPIELSAVPSPGRSRDPSENRNNKLPKVDHVSMNPKFAAPRHIPTKSKPGVSATVNGPLNIPSFDVLAREHELNKTAQKTKAAPITILARPTAAQQEAVSNRSPNALLPNTGPTLEGQDNTLEVSQPPAPRLSPRITVPKPKSFQPQILRRHHPQNSELDEPSPIQPLPSPARLTSNAHLRTLLEASTSRPAQDEHKKSLLSLFTSADPTPSIASPMISPPSATPGRRSRPESVNPTGLISPLVEDKLHGRIAALNENLMPGTAKQTVPELRGRDKSEALTPGLHYQHGFPSHLNTTTENNNSAPPVSKQTPTETKNRLLEYLADIKA